MAPDTLEIHSVHPLLRAYTVLVWAACGVFMIGLALRFPSAGHTFGLVLGAACLWAALYWWRVPDVRVTVRSDGMEWLDTSLGALMIFTPRRSPWSDVVAVETRSVTSRHGSYLRTRVTVRDTGARGRTRRFTVTSRCDGYARFLDALATRTPGGDVATSGLGVRSARVHLEMRRILQDQLRLIATFVLVSGAALLLAFLIRR
jgi:hypothetical protein